MVKYKAKKVGCEMETLGVQLFLLQLESCMAEFWLVGLEERGKIREEIIGNS